MVVCSVLWVLFYLMVDVGVGMVICTEVTTKNNWQRAVTYIVRGRWQKRVLQTLLDAGGPLAFRQLRIRCGVVRPDSIQRVSFNLTCVRLVRLGYIRRVKRGVYTLANVKVKA